MQRFPHRSSQRDLAVGTAIEVRGHFRGNGAAGLRSPKRLMTATGFAASPTGTCCPSNFSGHDVRDTT